MSGETMDGDRIKSVCGLGTGELTCSFLMLASHGWICAKSQGNEAMRLAIDARRLAGTIVARGDRCSGFQVSP